MDDTSSHPDAHRRKGVIKRFLGWFTADRQMEAEGVAEARVRAEPEPATVDHAEEQVKQRYGETPEG